MSTVRKSKGTLGKGRVDSARLKSVTEAEIATWKRDEGYADFEVSDDARLVPAVDVRRMREDLGLTQEQFAAKFLLPLRTIQEWEQGRKDPSEPARVLLYAIAQNPKAIELALLPTTAKGGARRP